jgi:hypothetical protein
MQALWDKAMFLERTRGAYGCAFPMPGSTYQPPTPGTMLHSILFVVTASEEEYQAHLAEVRADMENWKARVKVQRKPLPTFGIDTSKLEFKL